MRVFRNPFAFHRRCASAVIVGALLTACGGGGGGGGAPAEPPATPTGLAVSYDVKAYSFTWDTVPGATFYRLYEDPDGPGPLPAAQVGGDLTQTGHRLPIAVLLNERLNARYTASACNAAGCSAPSEALKPSLTQAIGYLKASNTGASHYFGTAVDLSRDGSTLVVGAPGDDSSSPGVNGPETTNPALAFAGAVQVYVRDKAGIWSKQAYLKAKNPGEGDRFGGALALSADGNTLAVGATTEDSNATNVGGDETNNSQPDSGAVYVFSRSPAGTWSQQAYVKASDTLAGDQFGYSLDLSADGNTLAVGAIFERSNGSDPDNVSFAGAGAAYVYVRDSLGAWSFQDYLKANNPQVDGQFGFAVALSANGDRLAVGSSGESTTATYSGAVYLFARGDTGWSQEKFLKASNAGEGDGFGTSIALSADGDTLAVGAPYEAGDGSDKSNNDLPAAGAAYLFVRTGTGWEEQAYVKASNPDDSDAFGISVALTDDGNKLAVGAEFEDSAAVGVGSSNQGDAANGTDSGAVYVFGRSNGTWTQQAYVKRSTFATWTYFGRVALSGDGNTMAVGSRADDGRTTGFNGNPYDAGWYDFDSGAVYLY